MTLPDGAAHAQVTFILLGKYLEASAKGRTSAAIQALLTLAPPTALLLEGGDADAPDAPAGKGGAAAAPATEREVPTALIHRGDRLKVRGASTALWLLSELRQGTEA
jgi:Cu+-exporting ATPase